MALRVTTLNIDVLVLTPSSSVYTVDATSALALTDSAGETAVWNRSASSVNTLDQLAACHVVYSRDTASTLALTHEGYPHLEGQSAISVTDTLGLSVVWNRSASSANTLGHVAQVTCVVHASSALTLTSSLDYVGPKPVLAQTSLVLGDDAHRCQPFLVWADSPLSLRTVADVRGPVLALAANALSLLSLADRGVYIREAGSALDLQVTLAADLCHMAASTLSLASVAVQGQVSVQVVSQLALVSTVHPNPLIIGPGPNVDIALPATTIDLQQSVATSIHMMAAQSVLTITDRLASRQPWCVTAESQVQTVTLAVDPATLTVVEVVSGLEDTAGSVRIGAPLATRQYLQLAGAVSVVKIKAGAKSAGAESSLALSHDVYQNVTGAAVNYLVLAGEAAADRCLPLETALELGQAATVTLSGTRLAESALALAHSLAYVVAKSDVLRQYHPFVGEGAAGAPTPPPVSLAEPEQTAVRFQLFYPASGTATDSVTLRAPNLGNKDRLSFNRVLRETRGGTLVVFADPVWPRIQTLVFTFAGLRSTQAQELLTFLDVHLGEEVGLLDWEGRSWSGVVMTPSEPVVQDGKDSFSASLEFEGALA